MTIAEVSTPPTAAPSIQTSELSIQGMTCAACVRRIERALTKVPGVRDATVNLITERATIQFEPSVATLDALRAAVEKAGYQASLPAPAAAPAVEKAEPETRVDAPREERELRRDLRLAVLLSVPLLVLAMSHGLIPGTEGELGRAAQFALATPVVFGPGRRFLRPAWRALRHKAADMNTLVSIGVLAAWGYSAIAVLAPVGKFDLSESLSLPGLYPSYIRGLAFLEMGDGASAAGEFQRILAHPGAVGRDLIGALAVLQLARAHSVTRRDSAAAELYQAFFSLWQDADHDVPIYRDARTEYDALRTRHSANLNRE